MEVSTARPKLVSFRTLSFTGENRRPAGGNGASPFALTHYIEVGLAVPNVAGGILQAVVKIDLKAVARSEDDGALPASFHSEFEARFDYPAGVNDALVLPKFEAELYQYVLVAQAFPLAMTHFGRELQSMGFDARDLPLGL